MIGTSSSHPRPITLASLLIVALAMPLFSQEGVGPKPASPGALLAEAEFLLTALGDVTGARELCARVLKEDPLEPAVRDDARFLLARIHTLSGDSARARQELQSIVEDGHATVVDRAQRALSDLSEQATGAGLELDWFRELREDSALQAQLVTLTLQLGAADSARARHAGEQLERMGVLALPIVRAMVRYSGDARLRARGARILVRSGDVQQLGEWIIDREFAREFLDELVSLEPTGRSALGDAFQARFPSDHGHTEVTESLGPWVRLVSGTSTDPAVDAWQALHQPWPTDTMIGVLQEVLADAVVSDAVRQRYLDGNMPLPVDRPELCRLLVCGARGADTGRLLAEILNRSVTQEEYSRRPEFRKAAHALLDEVSRCDAELVHAFFEHLSPGLRVLISEVRTPSLLVRLLARSSGDQDVVDQCERVLETDPEQFFRYVRDLDETAMEIALRRSHTQQRDVPRLAALQTHAVPGVRRWAHAQLSKLVEEAFSPSRRPATPNDELSRAWVEFAEDSAFDPPSIWHDQANAVDTTFSRAMTHLLWLGPEDLRKRLFSLARAAFLAQDDEPDRLVNPWAPGNLNRWGAAIQLRPPRDHRNQPRTAHVPAWTLWTLLASEDAATVRFLRATAGSNGAILPGDSLWDEHQQTEFESALARLSDPETPGAVRHELLMFLVTAFASDNASHNKRITVHWPHYRGYRSHRGERALQQGVDRARFLSLVRDPTLPVDDRMLALTIAWSAGPGHFRGLQIVPGERGIADGLIDELDHVGPFVESHAHFFALLLRYAVSETALPRLHQAWARSPSPVFRMWAVSPSVAHAHHGQESYAGRSAPPGRKDFGWPPLPRDVAQQLARQLIDDPDPWVQAAALARLVSLGDREDMLDSIAAIELGELHDIQVAAHLAQALDALEQANEE